MDMEGNAFFTNDQNIPPCNKWQTIQNGANGGSLVITFTITAIQQYAGNVKIANNFHLPPYLSLIYQTTPRLPPRAASSKTAKSRLSAIPKPLASARLSPSGAPSPHTATPLPSSPSSLASSSSSLAPHNQKSDWNQEILDDRRRSRIHRKKMRGFPVPVTSWSSAALLGRAISSARDAAEASSPITAAEMVRVAKEVANAADACGVSDKKLLEAAEALSRSDTDAEPRRRAAERIFDAASMVAKEADASGASGLSDAAQNLTCATYAFSVAASGWGSLPESSTSGRDAGDLLTEPLLGSCQDKNEKMTGEGKDFSEMRNSAADSDPLQQSEVFNNVFLSSWLCIQLLSLEFLIVHSSGRYLEFLIMHSRLFKELCILTLFAFWNDCLFLLKKLHYETPVLKWLCLFGPLQIKESSLFGKCKELLNYGFLGGPALLPYLGSGLRKTVSPCSPSVFHYIFSSWWICIVVGVICSSSGRAMCRERYMGLDLIRIFRSCFSTCHAWHHFDGYTL